MTMLLHHFIVDAGGNTVVIPASVNELRFAHFGQGGVVVSDMQVVAKLRPVELILRLQVLNPCLVI